jgi:hypothetical protein
MTNLRAGKDYLPKISRKKFQNHENAIPKKGRESVSVHTSGAAFSGCRVWFFTSPIVIGGAHRQRRGLVASHRIVSRPGLLFAEIYARVRHFFDRAEVFSAFAESRTSRRVFAVHGDVNRGFSHFCNSFRDCRCVLFARQRVFTIKGRTLRCASLMTLVLSVELKSKETANDFHSYQQQFQGWRLSAE